MPVLIWRGINYHSLEYFNLNHKNNLYVVESTIIGSYKENLYKVIYELIIDNHWLISEFKIISEVNSIRHLITGKKIGNQWEINGLIKSDFNGFEYIDISLTPSTNSLPINNLHLKTNHPKEISVIYIDVLNHQIKTTYQRYTKVNDCHYFYENIENDFKADLLIDEKGWVQKYPGLFEKVADQT
ncbi:putative glycolipid-binding domain-containing protein [Chryseobacterium sp. OSA05B]|uniref:putative glycolipid-binding domain-containing protein n=1 Tax=Chryseobacterium sp. OSA05B TaxID=2862650 RepID=UPI001CBCA1A7|nr:putative glycolipid-binding domain-containing protein [Chryseobacterium sp. OSA05B]